MKTGPYVRLERKIATGERGDVLVRWRYGRQLVDDRAGRNQLPHGMRAGLIKAAQRVGIKLSDAEISYRMQCAETYSTEAQLVTAVTSFGSWSALRDAGFPPVEPDGSDPEHIEAEGLDGAPDEWEQLQFDIPGLKETITVRGRKVPVKRGEDGATVADVAAYLAMCEQMHDNFGKTVDQISESLATMREGSGGDDDANAVEAWEAASADDVEPAPSPTTR